jgi:orotate phosphoribosyltransferase
MDTANQTPSSPLAAAANTSDEEVLNIFRASGALLTGHFVLRSGLRSGHFFQCAQVCQDMAKVTRLAELLIEKLSPEAKAATTVAAPAMGGLVIGQEVARQLNKRFIFLEKVDDRLALRRGFTFAQDESILIVEDVITRGGRVEEAITQLRAHGGTPVAAAMLVDRSEGKTQFDIPHFPLIALSFPTYSPDNLPAELAAIPAVKPGS